jgi:uncharacterized protein YjbI with pentapeptide repeats
VSEQESALTTVKRHRSHQTSKSNGTAPHVPQHPANDDSEAWKRYWKIQGQPWRFEPEISEERQEYLNERRSIMPDIERGIYSFKSIKLSRADVEWLLATHDNGRGPVDWSDVQQRYRHGLDLRGADLRQRDLRGLPLARTIGGLDPKIGEEYAEECYRAAALHLESADLRYAYLESAVLNAARLENAFLDRAHLEGAFLR